MPGLYPENLWPYNRPKNMLYKSLILKVAVHFVSIAAHTEITGWQFSASNIIWHRSPLPQDGLATSAASSSIIAANIFCLYHYYGRFLHS